MGALRHTTPGAPIALVAVALVVSFALLTGALRGIVTGATLIDVLSTVAGLALLGVAGLALWRRRRVGATLLALGWAPLAPLYGALAAAFMAILFARLLAPGLRQPSALLLNLGWAVFCLAYVANRPRIGARGIVAGALFLPWGRVDSYEVGPAPVARDAGSDGDTYLDPGAAHTMLTVRYRPSPDPSPDPAAEPRATTLRCPAAKRAEIELLLARYVRTEQGHRRWHARRVRPSALVTAAGPAPVAPGL